MASVVFFFTWRCAEVQSVIPAARGATDEFLTSAQHVDVCSDPRGGWLSSDQYTVSAQRQTSVMCWPPDQLQRTDVCRPTRVQILFLFCHPTKVQLQSVPDISAWLIDRAV